MQAVPPTPQPAPGAPPAGPALASVGRHLVGRLVMRYWPEDQGWWEAYVGDYSSTRGHKLLYEHNTPDESQVGALGLGPGGCCVGWAWELTGPGWSSDCSAALPRSKLLLRARSLNDKGPLRCPTPLVTHGRGA